MSTVFEDPMQLVKADKVTEFWPNNSQSSDERINATARFIIYATCIIYLIKRDARFRCDSSRRTICYAKIKHD